MSRRKPLAAKFDARYRVLEAQRSAWARILDAQEGYDARVKYWEEYGELVDEARKSLQDTDTLTWSALYDARGYARLRLAELKKWGP